MTSLIITLPRALPAAATLCEGVLTDDGRTVQRHVQATLALLPAPAGLEVVAVVPASRLSWHRVELPQGALKGSTARLRAVLDGLLEDHLLDDTAQLHFAMAPQARAQQPVWVAACERVWLYAWLAALEQADRPAARIVPELAPPAADAPAHASLQATGSPDNAQLLLTGPGGVTVLPLSTATAALLAWPQEAELLAEPSVAALAESHFKRPVTLQTAPERWLAAAQSGWDLAQFDLLYTRRTRTRKQLSSMVSALLRAPRWRAARWAAVTLVVINVAGLQAWAWKQESALAAQRSAIRGILLTTFPEVRVVVDAPLQMARALADLQRRNGAASVADLETMLGQFQAAAPDMRPPAGIEFVAGELRLKGLEPSGAGLASVATRLQAQGYSTRIEGDSLVLKEERLP
ncbi:MAG: type II secretion system protein GspL [Pseudomonadota bacterium]|nr:type II secretion system protein GspL [Pseudomonadota bacterium]